MLTFLSPNVHHLVCLIHKNGKENVYDTTCSEEEIWKAVSHDISNHTLITPENYIEAVKILIPFAKFVECNLSSKGYFCTAHDDVYLWLSKYDMFPTKMSITADGAEKMTNLLKLVSTIERALGDMCVELGDMCPFLLRDLLLLKKFESFFGAAIMKTLRVLMGSPHGVNIRNLAWHGFLQLHEIPDIYISLLWFVLKKMAEMLRKSAIKQRPVIENSTALTLLNQALLENGMFQVPDAINLSHCKLPMQRFLNAGLSLLQDSRYGDSVVLLLPCMEAYMRILYATANDCEHRVLTAESSELYTTMDEILSQFVDEMKENRFSRVLGDDVKLILIDLFQMQDGPRLRDKLSHGEMSLAAVSSSLAGYIFTVTLKLYVVAHSVTDWCCCDGRKSALGTSQPEDNETSNSINAIVDNFNVFATSYSSLFHPLSLTSRSYSAARLNVIQFGDLPYPDEFRSNESTARNAFCREIPALPNWKTQLRNGRCEATSLLRRIAKESETSSSNVITFLRLRWQMHQARNLRSRQRTNYRKMIERLYEIRELFVMILMKAWRYLEMVGDHEKSSEVGAATTLKDLRRFLKTVENLRTLTAGNKWDDVCMLKHSFNETV